MHPEPYTILELAELAASCRISQLRRDLTGADRQRRHAEDMEEQLDKALVAILGRACHWPYKKSDGPHVHQMEPAAQEPCQSLRYHRGE